MTTTRRAPLRAPGLWWLTFVTCCALMLSPVMPAFAEESATPVAETGEIIVVVTPDDGTDAASGEDAASDGKETTSETGETAADPASEPVSIEETGGITDSGMDTAPDETAGEPAADPAPDDIAADTDPAAQDSVAVGATPPVDDGLDEADAPDAAVETASEPVAQGMAEVVEEEPEVALLMLPVEDAGLEPEITASLETLDASSETTITASTLAPVTDTPENVVAVLVGSGVTYSNVGYTGATVALGTFTGGSGIMGFEDGVILGTGNIADVTGPNDDAAAGTSNEQPGDDALATLAAENTYDAAVLTFDFVPAGNQIVFSYVFSSEEYNEYVNDGFNDVFAFYVNGENCATVNGGAVSIDTINNDSNADLYIDNEDAHVNTQMDGLTVVLTCQANVTPGATNTMKLAIADGGDSILDSNVFIQAKSFVVPQPSPTPSPSPTPVTPEPSPETPVATPTEAPGTPTPGTPAPTQKAEKPDKPHGHYDSYGDYADRHEDPVPAVALAITSSGQGGTVTALPSTGSGDPGSSSSHALVIAAAIGAGLSIAGAIRTSRDTRDA